uniref:Ig-like domain-containing protein n=1 Tax=Labrus bergylta TaxID=56723 RepID=A0A3Q3GP58_9LABR
ASSGAEGRSINLYFIFFHILKFAQLFLFHLLSIEIYPPVFVSKPDPMTLYVGKQAVFQCSLTGSTPMEVVWHKDNINKYSLHIKSLELTDQGVYLCKASNSVGAATFTTELNPARIVEPAESISVTAGDSATLECTICGSPDLKVKWFKDGKEMISGRKYKMTLKDNIASMKILASEKGDTSEYKMEVSNKVGKDQCTCSVTVLGLLPVSASLVFMFLLI